MKAYVILTCYTIVTSTTYSLFDLSSDPNEVNSIYDLASSADVVTSLSKRQEYWKNYFGPIDIPDKSTSTSAWQACGGLCPWLDSGNSTAVTDDVRFTSKNAPNIVFVLVDDWGWNDVGWRSTFMNWTTPTIDALAAEGVKLTNYYSHSSCVPARGALLTGRYHIRLGFYKSKDFAELSLNETTIAQEMRSAGYRTYMVQVSS
jgi:hypothetical protein